MPRVLHDDSSSRCDGGSCDSWSDGVAVTDDVVVRLSGVVVRLSGAHGAEPVVV